jgi:mannose-6-phosphate isomerase-like protein (cupin superfamily)
MRWLTELVLYACLRARFGPRERLLLRSHPVSSQTGRETFDFGAGAQCPGCERQQRLPSAEDGDRSSEPDSVGTLRAMDPLILEADAGEVIGAGGPARAVVKASSDTTSGGFTMTDSTIAPGFPGPPPHWHREITDSFYVLEGTLTVRLGKELVEAEPGTYICVPPGNVHTFSNRGDSPVRFLNIASPAGWENYLRDLENLLKEGSPDRERWLEVMSKYDFIPAE